jgi:Na+-translocating ferredoxin:NAD+ oxidoreductase RnfA subunit
MNEARVKKKLLRDLPSVSGTLTKLQFSVVIVSSIQTLIFFVKKNIDFFFREFFIFANLQRINCFGVYIAQQTVTFQKHMRGSIYKFWIN